MGYRVVFRILGRQQVDAGDGARFLCGPVHRLERQLLRLRQILVMRNADRIDEVGDVNPVRHVGATAAILRVLLRGRFLWPARVLFSDRSGRHGLGAETETAWPYPRHFRLVTDG